MSYHNDVRFYLLPADEEVAGLYPQGYQTLMRDGRRLDSGIDIPTPETVVVPAGETVSIDLKVRAVCVRMKDPPSSGIPGGVLSVDPVGLPWAFWLVPRSSTPLMMFNSSGLIDMGYRGSLIAKVWNHRKEDYTIERGQALFQVAASDLAPAEYEVLTGDDWRVGSYFSDGATRRGDGAFGSTGAGGSAAAEPCGDESDA